MFVFGVTDNEKFFSKNNSLKGFLQEILYKEFPKNSVYLS